MVLMVITIAAMVMAQQQTTSEKLRATTRLIALFLLPTLTPTFMPTESNKMTTKNHVGSARFIPSKNITVMINMAGVQTPRLARNVQPGVVKTTNNVRAHYENQTNYNKTRRPKNKSKTPRNINTCEQWAYFVHNLSLPL